MRTQQLNFGGGREIQTLDLTVQGSCVINYTIPPKTTSKFLKNFYYCLGCVVSHWLESKSNLPKQKAPVLRGAFCFGSGLWAIYSFPDSPKQKTHTIAPPAGRAGVAAVVGVSFRVSILVSL